MTVCIAAIFNGNCVVNAADRMISASNSLIKYEPLQSKIFRLTDDTKDTITAMTAGDMALQSETIQNVRQRFKNRKRKKRLTVQEVIEAYCDAYRTIHFRQIESAILVPQCLTLKSYFEKQKKGELSAALVNHIATQFDNFRQETEVETIISGIDDEGTHIYVIKNDEVRCESNNGYAAIGLGGWHAESQFMFAKYTSAWTLTDALFLAFKAKKRAEVAEGIGESTDMVTILPVNDRNPFITISRKRLEIFSEYYKQLEDVMASNEQKARDALKESYEETRSETIKHAAKADEAAIETKSDDKSDDERDF